MILLTVSLQAENRSNIIFLFSILILIKNKSKMQKSIFYYFIFSIYLFESCSGNKPKVGDAVFYEYTVKQGDSVVFKSSRSLYDTALTVVESPINDKLIERALMENVVKLSVNDSTTFDLGNQQKGFLRLYRIVPEAEFPKYIADANKQEKVFEQKLHEASKELSASLPFYQSRRKAVLDSTIALTKQYQAGQLNTQLKTLPTGIQYYVVKENGSVKPVQKKWVWFHYASVVRNSNKTVDSYNNLPKSTNLAEFAMIEELERSAARFDEGSIVLLLIPTKLAYPRESLSDITANGSTVFWIEVVKVLNL